MPHNNSQPHPNQQSIKQHHDHFNTLVYPVFSPYFNFYLELILSEYSSIFIVFIDARGFGLTPSIDKLDWIPDYLMIECMILTNYW